MENVKIKVEPGDPSQDVSQSHRPYAMKLRTEEGEVIIVKQEEEDDEVDDGSQSWTSSLNRSGRGGDQVRVKSAGSSRRSTCIDLHDQVDDPENSSKCSSSKAVPKQISLKLKIKEEKDTERDGRPIIVSDGESPDIGFGKIPIKVERSNSFDKPTANLRSNVSGRVVNKTTNGKSDEHPEKARKLVVSSDAAKALFKAAADNGTKAKADKSSTIKIVFDDAGKLKEWRVESKSAAGALPASNLSKILMFANMMKNGDGSSEQKPKSEEGKKDKVEKVGKKIVKPKEPESSEPLPKKIRICEDGTSGIVDADFEGFKCKICGKEYLHKQALTTHLKLHHLSLSGLPGSSADYSVPQSSVVKVELTSPAPSTSTTKTLSSGSSPPTSKFSSASTSYPSTRSQSSNKINIKYDTSLPPRPVILVSASTMSKLGPAVPESKSENDQAFVKVEQSSASKSTSTASSGGPFKCDFCSEQFSRQASLRSHVKSHHREKYFMCGICDNSYLQDSDLECHLLNHSNPNPKSQVLFTCSFCVEEFKNDKDLQEHLKTHGDIEADMVFECGMCGAELKSQLELRHHMRKHTGDPFEPCKCGICLSSFFQVSDLKAHLANKHFIDDFVCDFCKCRFMTAEALEAHMPVHDRLKEANIKFVHRWKCKQCSKGYQFKVDLVNHMKFEHKDQDTVACSFCESVFLTKYDLQAHVKTHSVVAHFL